jgi:type IV secretion system protein VirB9
VIARRLSQVAIAASVALASAASLASSPRSGAVFEALDGSSRQVQHVDFNDSLVIRILGFKDHPFVVDFGDDAVREIAGGGIVTGEDLQKGLIGGWEVTRVGPRVFVRPLAEGKRTTMIVVTAKGRTYVVDMQSAAPTAKDFDRRVSRVIVRHPAPPPPVLVAGAPVAPEPPPPPPPSLRNDTYSMEVVALDADIRPAEVFDDGRFTYFRFPGNTPVPAIYKSVPSTTEEWLVNSHREGDFIVLHGVGKLWNLRLEGSMVGVFNDAFDPYGAPATNGSTVVNQKRVTRP